MKNLFFTVLLLLPVTLFAQQKNQLKFNPYYISDPGRYASIEYGRSINENSQLSIGLLFHYNNTKENPDRHQEYYLHHRFKAYDNLEHLGLSLAYQYTFYEFNNNNISLFAYDQLMLRNMGARSARWVPIDTIFNYSNYGILVDRENSNKTYTHLRNLFSVENITGLGLEAKISNHLSVQMKTGIGFNYISNLPQPLFDKKSTVEYSFQYAFGISANSY